MPTNLELKARYPSTRLAEHYARRLNARRVGLLKQLDTYYRVRRGRLKVREMNNKQFELIYYQRSDAKSSRYSRYHVIPLAAPGTMKDVCAMLFGEGAIVRKQRLLYRFKNARIHIDRVRGLGSFVEFEVLVTKGKRQAEELMGTLRDAFGLSSRSIVGQSYSDLLKKKRTT
ncbi:MAG TPA: class IV adenylate cyclase [Bacteroidota bacterium]